MLGGYLILLLTIGFGSIPHIGRVFDFANDHQFWLDTSVGWVFDFAIDHQFWLGTSVGQVFYFANDHQFWFSNYVNIR